VGKDTCTKTVTGNFFAAEEISDLSSSPCARDADGLFCFLEISLHPFGCRDISKKQKRASSSRACARGGPEKTLPARKSFGWGKILPIIVATSGAAPHSGLYPR
jgi:hypothetical protein